jgi:hypothetical protein
LLLARDMSLLVAWLLAAEPAALSTAQPTVESEATINLFGAPLSSAGMLTGSVTGLSKTTAFYLPLGVTVALGPQWGLTAEISGALISSNLVTRRGWAIAASAGPTFFIADPGMNGPFVTPKLSFQLARPIIEPLILAGIGPIDLGAEISRSFLLGADLGYQLRRGNLTVAFVLGASAGYAFDQVNSVTTPFAVRRFVPTQRTYGFAWALNLNFLRLGYAF